MGEWRRRGGWTAGGGGHVKSEEEDDQAGIIAFPLQGYWSCKQITGAWVFWPFWPFWPRVTVTWQGQARLCMAACGAQVITCIYAIHVAA